MLKRQRPVTPSPAEEPMLLAGSSSMDVYDRDIKRRRTVAPSLDGPSRGWTPQSNIYDDAEDEEDVWEYEAGKDGEGAEESQEVAGQYRASNSLLHDLHAEHQHRMIFSSPAPPWSAPGPTNAPPSSYTQRSQSSYGSMLLSKQKMPHLSERSNIYSHPDYLANSRGEYVQQGAETKDGIDSNEVERVKERYEDTNRLLRSLFLSRRRDLPGDNSGCQLSTGSS